MSSCLKYMTSVCVQRKINVNFASFVCQYASYSQRTKMFRQGPNEVLKADGIRSQSFAENRDLRRRQAESSILIQIPSRHDVSTIYDHIKHLERVKSIFHFAHVRIRDWMRANLLALNDGKTEVVWFSSRSKEVGLRVATCDVRVGEVYVSPSASVRDGVVMMDSAGLMDEQIKKDYALFEMSSPEAAKNILSVVSHFENMDKIPVELHVLYLLTTDQPYQQKKKSAVLANCYYERVKEFSVEEIFLCHDISEQMQVIYEREKLTEVGSRLRYFVCSYLEHMLTGLFPHCQINPFGSSVNGFGRYNCDLDMVLNLLPEDNKKPKNSKLKFMTKKRTADERGFSQRTLHTIGDIIQQFVPLCTNVNKILRARVPIVKFHHEAANIECDLCFTNLSGEKMSELLYLYGELDPRVRPLIFTLRMWAKFVELTKADASKRISNFMLTMMTMFFLQTRPVPILPSIKNLQRLAGPRDRCVIEGHDCSIVSDISKIPRTSNDETLEDLLLELFTFFSTFNFRDHGITVLEGSTFRKPDFSALYIENPLELGHNIAKNVDIVELERLKKCSETALWTLENSLNKNTKHAWGIIPILQMPGEGVGQQKLDVKLLNLFSDQNTSPNVEKADVDIARDNTVVQQSETDHSVNIRTEHASNIQINIGNLYSVDQRSESSSSKTSMDDDATFEDNINKGSASDSH